VRLLLLLLLLLLVLVLVLLLKVVVVVVVVVVVAVVVVVVRYFAVVVRVNPNLHPAGAEYAVVEEEEVLVLVELVLARGSRPTSCSCGSLILPSNR